MKGMRERLDVWSGGADRAAAAGRRRADDRRQRPEGELGRCRQAGVAAPGEDSISIVDIGTDPGSPKVIANLELMNSIFGPPTNLAITPDEKLALATNAMNWVQEGDAWKPAPDNKVHVIDLEAEPPALIATVEVGQQPSGMAISQAGDLALVANRAGKSISVLAIDGKQVEHVGDVDMGAQVAAVAITSDGKRGLAVSSRAQGRAARDRRPDRDLRRQRHPGRAVAVQRRDHARRRARADRRQRRDGHVGRTVDTVSVIDLAAEPPRVIDKVVVGDAPEGLAISPTGQVAAAVLLNGSAGVPKDAWFANPSGKVVVLAIDGKKVTKAGEVDVGGLPEGVVFSKDGGHLYVGNYTDGDVSVLKVDGSTVTNTGQDLQLPGHPASMRGSHP